MNDDVIVIHLGKSLSDAEYNAVVSSVVAFLNKRYPNFDFRLPS